MIASRREFLRVRSSKGGQGTSPPASPRPSAGAPPPNPPIELYLAGNTNPMGPGPAALRALKGALGQASRYPYNSKVAEKDLVALLAKNLGATPAGIVLGAGSGEILQTSVHAFTSPTKPLVTCEGSYEEPSQWAKKFGSPLRTVPLDKDLRFDLEALAGAARGGGLVFLCTPNNPTATTNPAKAVTAFIERVRKESPDTAILVDEAYYEYVTDPGHETAVPQALAHPNVFVLRTFSKGYGMAGLRLGYAVGQPATIKALARYRLPNNINVPTISAAIASLGDPAHIQQEKVRNAEARDVLVQFFRKNGFSITHSQTNFIYVDVGRPAQVFRDECLKYGVLPGRGFEPHEKSHSRISVGTREQMQKAVAVFAKVLGVAAPAAVASRS